MRDYRNDLIQDLKEDAMTYLSSYQLDRVLCSVSELLDSYELSERVTALVTFEDSNAKLIKSYLSCLMLNGKSQNTLYAYRRHLERFVFFTRNRSLKETTTFDIRNYLAHEKVRGLSGVSLENIRVTLHAYFQWMTDEEYIARNPCAALKPIKCVTEIKIPFSSVEQDSLRNGCETDKERAIVEFLLSSGVRASELVNLNVEDVDFTQKMVHVRHGKGDKERYTYINDVAMSYLVKYLMAEQIESGPLFQNRRNGRYTTAGIRCILNAIASKACVKHVHPHRFRRTFATTLAARGMDLHEIRYLMGHADINTTMVYVTTDDTKVSHSYRKFTT